MDLTDIKDSSRKEDTTISIRDTRATMAIMDTTDIIKDMDIRDTTIRDTMEVIIITITTDITDTKMLIKHFLQPSFSNYLLTFYLFRVTEWRGLPKNLMLS